MKEKAKKLISTVIICSMVLSIFGGRTNKIKADEVNIESVENFTTDAPNLIDNYDEDSALCKKLEYDVENHATKLKSDVEEDLNKIGVFDEEIEDLDDDTINTLNKSINTHVYVSYDIVNNLTGQYEHMKDDEIDNLVEEEITKDNLDYEEEEDSILEKVGTILGIEATKVNAAEPKYEKWDHPTGYNALKQTVYACQFKKGGIIYVTAKATWVKEAHYRNKDVFGVRVSRADIISKSWKCEHTVTHRTESFVGQGIFGKWIKTKDNPKTNPTAWKIVGKGDGIMYTVNLFGDRTNMNRNLRQGVQEYYDNEKIQIKFQCKPTSKKATILTTHYWHSKTNKSISPSIGFSSGGVSVGVSGSSKNYYEEINHNAYLVYNHI